MCHDKVSLTLSLVHEQSRWEETGFSLNWCMENYLQNRLGRGWGESSNTSVFDTAYAVFLSAETPGFK